MFFDKFEDNLLFSFEKKDSKEFVYKLKFNSLNEVNDYKEAKKNF